MIKNKKISSFWRLWGKTILLGILILLAFSLLRLLSLTLLPVFADEAIYIRWSQVMRAEATLRFLPLSDGKQPLFMWVTIPLLKIFMDPLWAGRFLSVLSGLGSLIGIFFLSWGLFKKKWVSLSASCLYAILPFFVFFDRLALVDSMLLMFGVWLAYLSVLLVRRPRLDLGLIMGLVLAGALITKSPAIFFALMIPASLILGKSLKKNILSLSGLWLLIWALGFGFYNFLLRLGPGFQMIALRNKDYLFTFREILTHPLDPLKPHLVDLFSWLPNLFTLPVCLLVLLGLFWGLRKKLKETVFLLVWFIVPLFPQMLMAKVFTPRYILFTLWPLVILAAFGGVWLFEQLRLIKKGFQKKFGLILMAILFFLIIFPSLKYDFLLLTNPEKAPLPRNLRNGHLEEWTAGQGLKESAEFLKQKSKEGPVFVGTEGSFGTLPDGLQIYLEGVSNVRVIGVGWPINEVSQSLVNSVVDNQVYLLVNQSRLNIAPEINGLKIIKEYPKAFWPDGHQDKLFLFEVDRNFWEKKIKEI
jgi:4-amino-4-deoxy-L-arabinose transferase-like glycosyltransferase